MQQVFELKGHREERLHLKTSTGGSFGSLETCAAIQVDNMKMESMVSNSVVNVKYL